MKVNTTSFVAFIGEHGGNKEAAQQLADSFEKLPAADIPASCQYVNPAYSKEAKLKQQAVVEQAVADKVFGTLTLSTPNPRADLIWCSQHYGFIPFAEGKPETAYKGFLYGRAAQFRFMENGSCSYRCMHAALRIREILGKSPLKVAVQSDITKDQFAVCIGNKASGWFVYDPLTNGRLIFPFETYQAEVLSKFPETKQRNLTAFKLTVTAEMTEDFAKRWPKIRDGMCTLAEERKETAEALASDPSLRLVATEAGVPKKQLPGLAALATEQLQKQAEKSAALK